MGDTRGLLVEISRLMNDMANGTLESKSVSVKQYHALAERAVDDHFEALKRQSEAESSKGGLFSDLEKACGDALKDAVHLRVSDIVSDVKDDTVSDPQFWKDLASTGATVAKWAAVVGTVAVAIGLTATGAGGPVAAGLAIAAAAMTTAGAAESEFGVLEKMGVDAKVAQWVGIGLSVGGAATGAGAGLAAAATAEEAQAANALASADASDSGADAAAVAADAAQNATELSTSVTRGVEVVGAGGEMVTAAGKIGSAHFESQAIEADADAQRADATENRARRLLDAVEKTMRDTYQAAGDATTAISNTMMKQNEMLANFYSARMS